MSKPVFFVEHPDLGVFQNVLFLSKIRILGYVKTCVCFCLKYGFVGMSKHVCLSKIRICGYVKTCFVVENPDVGVCQNVVF